MRLGLVGAGEVAWRHAAAAAEVDGLTLTTVFDPVPARAARLAETYGARAVAGFDEVLDAVDLVVLAVPHALHESLALRALEAGRKVLVEKPLATTVESCDRMIGYRPGRAAARGDRSPDRPGEGREGRDGGRGGPEGGRRNALIGSAGSESPVGGSAEAGEAADVGEVAAGVVSGAAGASAIGGAAVGELLVGQQGRFFGQVQAARDELARLGEPLLYVERRSADYRRPHRPAWFADPVLAGGGIVMLVGVHSIDRASWLLGSPPVAVAGSIATPVGWSVETSAAGTVHLGGGLRAHLALIDSPEFFHETTVVCSRGTLVIDPSGLSVDGRRVLTVHADREYTASFRRQYQALLRGEPMATLAEGRLAVATVRAWYRSAAGRGVPVSV
jgi:predicted dehydrogenase